MARRSLVALAGLAFLGLLAATCGGSEGSPTSQVAASPPPREFPTDFRRATPDPDGGTVTGRVILGYGAHSPVTDHIVQIDCGTDSDGETLWCLGWTQQDGSFSVSGVPQGLHRVAIRYIEVVANVVGPGATVDLGTLEFPLVHPPDFQLAYGDDDGDMWGVYDDFSQKMNLTEDSPLRCGQPYWSPNGAWLACLGREGDYPEEKSTLVIVDTAGNPRIAMEPKASLASFSWSPTGQDYAYVLAMSDGSLTAYVQSIVSGGPGEHPAAVLEGPLEVLWSPDGNQLAYSREPTTTLAIYDLASQRESIIGDGLRPLAWVLGGKALLTATDHHEIQGLFAAYSANLLDLATHELKPVPQLDNDAQFWLSPDGHSLAFYRRGGISLLDLSTGAVSPIPNAIPSLREWISPDHVAFSPNGTQLFWADIPLVTAEGQRPPTVIYRADLHDGGGMTKIGEVESVEIKFSPDRTKILYNGKGTGDNRALWVANIDGSDARMLAEDAWPAAWRPLAPYK